MQESGEEEKKGAQCYPTKGVYHPCGFRLQS